jgi:hypothetical protein
MHPTAHTLPDPTLFTCLIGLALLVCLLPAWADDIPAPDAGLIFVGDFEDGSMDQYRDSHEATVSKTEIVTSPVRAGQKALKVTLDREAHREIQNHRTDFWLRGMSGKCFEEQDYWYGFSTYLPADWEPDTQSELYVQWVPGHGATRTSGGPTLAIYVYGEQYRVKKRWGAGAKDYKNLWRGDILADRGKWVDWVFHVLWSTGDAGRIEVWKNGEQIVRNTGINCVPADTAPYFKFGIYKWPWKTDEPESVVTRREVHFDEIRIAGGGGSYEMVNSPHGADIPAD